VANLEWLKETDMALVVSQSQNEIANMKAKGLDILTHRKRMASEDLDEKFKDPGDRLRLVFVCAMWITGFDVPTCSTVYPPIERQVSRSDAWPSPERRE